MNDKYRLFFIIALLQQTGFSIAQNLEITVLNKISQPIPYAYILVNGKPISICDTLGIAKIPTNILSNNDSISVSYLGVAPAFTIYDKTLKESKKHTFYLDDSPYMLNDVIIKYQDIEKLFKKSIKKMPALNYNCNTTAKFDARILNHEGKVSMISGSLEAENEMISKDFNYNRYGWFHHPLKFFTEDDTSRITKLLHSSTHSALQWTNLALVLCNQNNYGNIKPYYSYLGEKDNYRVFRLSYPITNTIGYSYQLLLYVDKYTEYLKSFEFAFFNLESNNKPTIISYNICSDCEPITFKKKSTIMFPSKIRFNVKMTDGTDVEISLSNFVIKI